MTANEFKKVLNNAGIDFSIWGYEGILNIVSAYCNNQETEYRNKGVDVLADMYKEKANRIYEYLVSIGYYK